MTRQAIQKWKTELPKVFGEEHVARALARAERLGRLEATKEMGMPDAETVYFGDDPEGLMWAVINTPVSLDATLDLRRRGSGKRRQPNTKSR